MDLNLKNKLRQFRTDVLRFLLVLASTDSIALELDEISDSTSTPEPDLRGIIATLRRMKIGNDESLILPAGRDDRGRLRWQINESAVDKNELAKFLENEILGKEKLTYKK